MLASLLLFVCVVFAQQPNPPTKVQVIAGDMQVNVSWTQSTSGGVVGYRVTSASLHSTETSLTWAILYLPNGVCDSVTVVAFNSKGVESEPSKPSASFVPRPVCTWIGGSTSNWFDARGWDGGDVPDIQSKVVIPEGLNVNIDSSTSVYSLYLQGTITFRTDNVVLQVQQLDIWHHGQAECQKSTCPGSGFLLQFTNIQGCPEYNGKTWYNTHTHIDDDNWLSVQLTLVMRDTTIVDAPSGLNAGNVTNFGTIIVQETTLQINSNFNNLGSLKVVDGQLNLIGHFHGPGNYQFTNSRLNMVQDSEILLDGNLWDFDVTSTLNLQVNALSLVNFPHGLNLVDETIVNTLTLDNDLELFGELRILSALFTNGDFDLHANSTYNLTLGSDNGPMVWTHTQGIGRMANLELTGNFILDSDSSIYFEEVLFFASLVISSTTNHVSFNNSILSGMIMGDQIHCIGECMILTDIDTTLLLDEDLPRASIVRLLNSITINELSLNTEHTQILTQSEDFVLTLSKGISHLRSGTVELSEVPGKIYTNGQFSHNDNVEWLWNSWVLDGSWSLLSTGNTYWTVQDIVCETGDIWLGNLRMRDSAFNCLLAPRRLSIQNDCMIKMLEDENLLLLELDPDSSLKIQQAAPYEAVTIELGEGSCLTTVNQLTLDRAVVSTAPGAVLNTPRLKVTSADSKITLASSTLNVGQLDLNGGLVSGEGLIQGDVQLTTAYISPDGGRSIKIQGDLVLIGNANTQYVNYDSRTNSWGFVDMIGTGFVTANNDNFVVTTIPPIGLPITALSTNGKYQIAMSEVVVSDSENRGIWSSVHSPSTGLTVKLEEVCASGWVVNGQSCTQCPVNTFQDKGVCSACASGYHSPAGSSSNEACVHTATSSTSSGGLIIGLSISGVILLCLGSFLMRDKLSHALFPYRYSAPIHLQEDEAY